MRVVGTAGHVDHGKSTLVHALTGTDPDRLQEEKTRGLTIDLGFAWMDLPLAAGYSTTVGLVDVPGHIDFIKNMLAGVGGIDAAILVIAADEGVMPQTREHLAILDLLAVPTAVVALTKVDAVEDPEWLDLVELDVTELLETTHYAGAPIHRVSAVQGTGLDALRTSLAEHLHELPPRRQRHRPRLPVDRAFTVSGFGTVVTGTLTDGTLRVGDEIAIVPDGLVGRIRGMQSHHHSVEEADPGRRLALNLSGIRAEEVRRGSVVTHPDTYRATTLLDVSFRLLASAAKPLQHNQAVDIFTGASEVAAHVRLLGAERLLPGEEGWLQLRLARPLVAAAGDRYILRQPSPSATLGGGRILNPHPQRRWRRFDDRVLARFAVLAAGDPEEILLQTLARRPLLTVAELIAESGLDAETADQAVQTLRENNQVVSLDAGGHTRLLTPEQWSTLERGLQEKLAAFHKSAPLQPGMPRSEVRAQLAELLRLPELEPRTFNVLLAEMIAAGGVEADDAAVWQAGFSVSLTARQEQAVAHTLEKLAEAGYAPPPAADVLGMLGNDRALLDLLIARGELVRAGQNLIYRREEFTAMVDAVRAYLASHDSITLAEARDLWGTSRKFAQAVLEEMDARRITRRVGDARVLRS